MPCAPCAAWGLQGSLGAMAAMGPPPPAGAPVHGHTTRPLPAPCGGTWAHKTNTPTAPLRLLHPCRHEVSDFRGVLDVAFHPTQPWLFTAGADTAICLFVNP